MRSRRQRLGRRARVVIDTMLPSGADPALQLGAFDAGFDDFYDEFSRTASGPLRLGFRVALVAAIWISPLLIGRLPPLTRHRRGERERALHALATCGSLPLRQLVVVLKAVICFGYGADANVRRAIGYR